jgi:hypothetical protein
MLDKIASHPTLGPVILIGFLVALFDLFTNWILRLKTGKDVSVYRILVDVSFFIFLSLYIITTLVGGYVDVMLVRLWSLIMAGSIIFSSVSTGTDPSDRVGRLTSAATVAAMLVMGKFVQYLTKRTQ